MNDQRTGFSEFLSLSGALTGFSHFQLNGTGQAGLYFETLSEIVGESTLADLLRKYAAVEAKRSNEATFAEDLRRDILSSERFGPIARNLIKLWYLGTWYELPREWRVSYGAHEKDVDFVVSAASFTEGLLWPTIGVNPPAAKAQGYGTWSEKPSIP